MRAPGSHCRERPAPCAALRRFAQVGHLIEPCRGVMKDWLPAPETLAMRVPRPAQRFLARLSLTRQVALLSLLPVLALGVILTRVVENELVSRLVAQACQTPR